MKQKIILGFILLGVFAFLALNVRVGYAAPGAAPRTTGYEISWYTVDGGGAQDLMGGAYTLSGTIGQPDAGALGGGAYSLNGGFWNAAQSLLNQYFYLPFISK